MIFIGVVLDRGVQYTYDRYTFKEHVKHKNIQQEIQNIDERLNKFYLPLQNALSTSNVLWDDYKKDYGNRTIIEDMKKGIFNTDTLKWQRYMLSVFQPIHIEMKKIIDGNKHLLLDNSDLKIELDILVKHISQYQVIFSQWKSNDYTENFSVIPFPSKIHDKIKSDIDTLIQQKKQLAEKLNDH